METNAYGTGQAGISFLSDPIPSKDSPSEHRNFVSYYTSLHLNSNITLGKVLNTTLRCITLSALARKIGKAIQGGYDSHADTQSGKARYWTGAAVKGLANVTGGVCGAVSGLVTATTAGVANLIDFASSLLKILAFTLKEHAKNLFCWQSEGSEHSSNSNTKKLGFLRYKPSHLPVYLKRGIQEKLTAEEMPAARDASTLVIFNYLSPRQLDEFNLPEGYQFAAYNDIPKSVLAKRSDGSGGDGSAVTLHINKEAENDPRLLLKSDRWSALQVSVYIRDDGTAILAFAGMDPFTRPGSLKNVLAAGLGIEESGFQDAVQLVAEFMKKYNGKVELIGNSLGGGIAHFVAMKLGLKATAFNSMGLHTNLRDLLGGNLENAKDVIHINTQKDWLSQGFENSYTGWDASCQIGVRKEIPDSGRHNDFYYDLNLKV